MINITIFPHATPDNPQFAKTGTKASLSFEELHNLVMDKAWSPAILEDDIRKSDNFLYCEVMALDFDDGATVEEVHKKLKALNLIHSITFSKSHKKEKSGIIADRFRVIIQLSEKIQDLEIFNSTWAHLHSLFPSIDAQCKDPSRFYFACSKHEDDPILFLNGSKLEPIISQKSLKISQEIPTKKPEKTRKSRDFKVLGVGVLFFLKNAHTNLNGSWDTALHVASKELARGGFSKEDAKRLLESHCPSPFTDRDEKNFDRNFNKGLREGPYKFMSKKMDADKEEIFEFLLEELEEQYIPLQDDMGRRGIILKIKPNDLVIQVAKDAIERQVFNLVREHYDRFMDDFEVTNHVKNWLKYSPNSTIEPLPVKFKGNSGYSYQVLDFKPEEIKTPIFDEFISRCSNPDAIMAYTWSIFEPKSNRQQYLWLFGDGNDGKGSYTAFLDRCLGDTYEPASSDDFFKNRAMFNARLATKRLAVFQDTNSTSLVTSGDFKKLTGNDPVSGREIYGAPMKLKLFTKFILLANNLPQISSKKADQRRIILCKLTPPTGQLLSDEEYQGLWWKERSGILHKCKEVYDRIVENHRTIPCNVEDAEGLADDSEIVYTSLFEEFFTIGAQDDILTATEFFDTIRLGLKSRKITLQNFQNWLRRKMGIEKQRLGTKFVYYRLKIR